MVKELKELDKYPWTGHSAILGRRKNPLIPEVSDQKSEVSSQKAPSAPSAEGGLPFSFSSRRAVDHSGPEAGKGKKLQNNPENPVNPACPVAPADGTGVQEKPLAEKTIEDILLHFGETKRAAIKGYREFVEKGIKQGTREDLQGGGLVRSAGGETAGLLGRKAEEREKGDARILGSGDFVSKIVNDANESVDAKALRRVSLDDLVSRVCSSYEVTLDELVSKRRKREISRARAVLCYLAVDELDYSGEDLARILAISGRGVSDCRDRGQKIVDNPEIIREYLS